MMNADGGVKMKREQFVKITEKTRAFVSRGAWAGALLNVPTYLCAALYIASGIWMLATRDARIVRFALVPAATFVLVTLLRRAINRPRPYDALSFEPVGDAKRGKGLSMPSRHTASAAAIAFAFAYAFAHPAVTALCAVLCMLVALSRVLKGVHYPSDVAVALLFSLVCALIGYGCI